MNTTHPPRAGDLQSPSAAPLNTTRLFSLAPIGGEGRGEGKNRSAYRARAKSRDRFHTAFESARRFCSVARPLT
ncbi:MAG: hypothetical protein ABMA26_24040, partial [Limisphaerales bacterium]